ncbi:MAG: GNAT family N-acetyltransferase [Planctomycetes bacterium]|nr:GNAT family N-acetyltransferase [Planctomycetota bacterium]MCC7169263.1 GNAT family N-acetyltransferase [Planctomycetota bacterium]
MNPRVLETARLALGHLEPSDAEFILRLVNEPSWLQFIGDKGVRSLDDARAYIANGPAAMIARHGFGLYLTSTKADGVPIGLCGLIKRDALDDVDIGFAFVPESWGKGYAREAAAATLEHAQRDFGLRRVVAITSQDNARSKHLLESIGFRFERMVKLAPEASELCLFAWETRA